MVDTSGPLFDIGANLLDSQLYKNFDQIIIKSKENNVRKIIITSSHINDTHEAKKLIDQQPGFLYTTVGFHPHNAKDFCDSHLKKMMELCKHDYVKAIGECGLDYKRNISNKDDQIHCFTKHLELAALIDLPMFLHEREAYSDFVILLKEHIHLIEDAVVHCFTGNKKSLKSYLDLGCYIGITGWITDPKRGYHLHDLLKYIPSDKLMIETDSPYLMPFNYSISNKKYNEPSNLIHVLDAVASILKKDKNIIAKEIYNNSCRFFNIKND